MIYAPRSFAMGRFCFALIKPLRHGFAVPERSYFAAVFLFSATIYENQSMVVLVRPTPSTAVEIFFQLLQPQTPSTRRLVRR